jgi:hypothetical protein
MIIAYLCPFTKVFKTNRKKPTIVVSNYVEQNKENEEVDIEKLNAHIAEIVIRCFTIRYTGCHKFNGIGRNDPCPYCIS